jgi:hypothetical protein
MTNEERDLITRFIERAAGVQTGGFGSGQGQQPPAQSLPPIDREADALIAELFNRYPEARYRITQMAFVQEHALVEAQNRINRLEWELQQARQAQQQAAPPPSGTSPWGAAAQPQPPQQPSRGGLFSGLFGGGRSAPPPPPPPGYGLQGYYPPPPPPQYPPGYNPGLFQPQGTGFFGSALRTAAGVAGGVLAADALMNLFSGGHHGFASSAQAAEVVPGGFTNPWGGGAEQASFGNAPPVDPYDIGGAPKEEPQQDYAQPDDGGQVDQSAWQPDQQADQSGWQDASDQGGDWDQSGDDSGWNNDDQSI